MNQQEQPQTPTMQINTPTLPKGGGAIQSIGKGSAGVGTKGTASLELPLPISPGAVLPLRWGSVTAAAPATALAGLAGN
ncbi:MULTISPECIES: hypothetical protein [unclassified Pseudomonas]|uniref:hypothetical protein n=1 Tax=unclassified Pseudomonas TaxID=196821 RepID=UPI00215BB1F3|nr:hypothetical protein [Pseudomonas sp. S11P7]MCR8974189.1 hypothetical protein [Pseudomonas sp. S11P7]